MKKNHIIIATLFCLLATASQAATPQENAFTRAAKKPLKGIMTPVEAKFGDRCGGARDCRATGRDRTTVWQMDNNTSYAPRDYPERCYVLGDGGKYYYQQSACR